MELNAPMVRCIDMSAFRKAGLVFRNEVVVGPGGRQALLEDPSGNLVELFEPAGTAKQ